MFTNTAHAVCALHFVVNVLVLEGAFAHFLSNVEFFNDNRTSRMPVKCKFVLGILCGKRIAVEEDTPLQGLITYFGSATLISSLNLDNKT